MCKCTFSTSLEKVSIIFYKNQKCFTLPIEEVLSFYTLTFKSVIFEKKKFMPSCIPVVSFIVTFVENASKREICRSTTEMFPNSQDRIRVILHQWIHSFCKKNKQFKESTTGYIYRLTPDIGRSAMVNAKDEHENLKIHT